MKIYTKTGDTGTTSLFGGKRVSKSDIQIECIGTIDELSSFIGFAKISLKNIKITNLLTLIQKDLYSIMAVLSGSVNTPLLLVSQNIKVFENTIDSLTLQLPDLTDFILMQNNEQTTRLHLARTVCRRTERIISLYINRIEQNNKSPLDEKKLHAILAQYFNRLSDLLFTMARFESEEDEIVKG